MRSLRRSWVPIGGGSTSSSSARLKLVSYNVLTEGLALSSKHDYCAAELREWGPRSGRLVEEVTGYGADIVCLQECTAAVAFPVFCGALGPGRQRNALVESHEGGDSSHVGFHHSAWLPADQRAEAAGSTTSGLATFVRSSAWKPVAAQAVRLGSVGLGSMASPAAASGGAKAPRRLQRDLHMKLRGRDEAVLMLLLEHASGARLAVGNTHLHWDPRQPHLKAVQAEMAARALGAFAEAHHTDAERRGRDLPICLVGDFNSVPVVQPEWLPSAQRAALPEPLPPAWRGSAVYSLLSEGELPGSHPEHPDAWGQASPGGGAGPAAAADDAPRRFKKGKTSAGLPRTHLAGPLRTGLALRDAYAGGLGDGPLPLTTNASDFKGTLDYIWVGGVAAEGEASGAGSSAAVPHAKGAAPPPAEGTTGRAGSGALAVQELLGMPYGGENAAHFGPIPDEVWPSDHLAIGAVLAVPLP